MRGNSMLKAFYIVNWSILIDYAADFDTQHFKAKNS